MRPLVLRNVEHIHHLLFLSFISDTMLCQLALYLLVCLTLQLLSMLPLAIDQECAGHTDKLRFKTSVTKSESHSYKITVGFC